MVTHTLLHTTSPHVDKREEDRGHLSLGELNPRRAGQKLKETELRKREPLSLSFTSTAFLFSSTDLKAGLHARDCTLFPGEHFSSPTTDMKSTGLPAGEEALRAAGEE